MRTNKPIALEAHFALGANHNHANEFGKTAVQEAQAQGHDQIVMMLLNQV